MSVFRIKSVAEIERSLHDDVGDQGLRRTLTATDLVMLGIGAVIGAGIFSTLGTAAVGEAGVRLGAGPALVLSFVLLGAVCALAGLCYAELTAMIPVAGSAYTYAYATTGELVAWIIGWDLMLEYALSASTVAVGWSGYFVSLMKDLGVHVPPELTGAPGASIAVAGGGMVTGVFNLPAAIIILLVMTLLVVGIRESANVNTALVVVKAAVLVIFVVAGLAYVNRDNLTPFVPPNTGEFGQFGWSGVLRGAGVMFFAYIGFDAVS